MPEKFIPFTTFAPGSPEHGTGLLRAENVIPALGAWRPMPQMSSGGGLVASGPLLGGYFHIYPSGLGTGAYAGDAVTEFWGSKLNLYTYAAGAFTSRSRGGGYSAGALVPAEWNFCSFGNDIWAANGVDALQRRTNNAGNFANGVASPTFAPVPRFVATVRDSLVCAYLNQANRFADEIAISDVGDATWFDPQDANRVNSTASNQRIRSRPGQITGLVGGRFGRIFKRRSLHSLIFTGATDYPFNVDDISVSTGTPCGKSIVECSDGFIRFWGGDAFYRQIDTAPPEKISPASVNNLLIEANMDQVWKYALTRTSPTTMYDEGLRIIGAESRQSGIVFWLVLTSGASSTVLCRMIAHDPTSGEWGLVNLEGAAGAGFIAAQTGLSCIMGLPVNVTDSFGLTWDIVGASSDLVDSTRVVFDGLAPMQATYATQRFSLADEGALSTANPRVTGFMPVASRDALGGSPDYNLRALPDGVTVRIVAANDPHFVITSEGGTQVSPRNEMFTRDTDFGWWTGSMQGRWFIAEMVYPAGGVNERGFIGAYIRWE